jgi:hypothetical protein
MQTSFMHPPFGFALFFLRSVAPASVKTTEIYWGAVPFVIIQLIMVAVVIAAPGLVTRDSNTALHLDPNEIQIDLPPPPDNLQPIEIPPPGEVFQEHFSGKDEFGDEVTDQTEGAPNADAP